MVSPSEKLCARAVTRTWSHLAIIPSRFFASRCCIMSLVGHTTRLRWSGGTCVSVQLAECFLLAPDWPKRHRFRLQRNDFQPFLLLWGCSGVCLRGRKLSPRIRSREARPRLGRRAWKRPFLPQDNSIFGALIFMNTGHSVIPTETTSKVSSCRLSPEDGLFSSAARPEGHHRRQRLA